MAEQPPPVASHQHAGYDAVYEVIRSTPGDARRNALIWRAVEAYRTASEPEHERQVRAAMGGDLIAVFQAMREEGESDMRTVIEHVRDAMRGGS